MEHAEPALLRAILATAVDAIIVIDGHGIVQRVNDATVSMFGYGRDELIGKNVHVLMPQPYRREHNGYLNNYAETGIAKIIGIGREVVGRRKDGQTFPMHLAVSEVEVNQRRWFAGIVRDISDLKKAQQKLADLNEDLEQRVQRRTAQLVKAQSSLVRAERLATLGKVSGGIAHEIRNPLSVIRTSAFFLRRAKDLSPEKMAEHLERIERQVAMIDNVVTALADVAKLPEPKAVRCRVEEVVRSVVDNTSLPAAIEVTCELLNLPDVRIDPNQIAIVFRNLVRNARDAMPNGGQLMVAGIVGDDSVAVSVRDTGPGIPADQLEKILEPLYSTKARGMGLGLAICQAILHKNRGHLRVESQLGVGTTFHIVLPRFDVTIGESSESDDSTDDVPQR